MCDASAQGEQLTLLRNRLNTAGLKRLCLSQAGACETRYGPPANILVYAVGGKHFAYFKTSEPERWRFSVRVSPDRFVELTDQPGVKPARYRGRYGWVTIVNVQQFPADYLTELVEWSYRHALATLTRAQRAGLKLPARGEIGP